MMDPVFETSGRRCAMGLYFGSLGSVCRCAQIDG